MTLEEIFQAVRKERDRQVEKFGEQNHRDTSLKKPFTGRTRANMWRSFNAVDQITGHINWETILLEEVYEASDEARAGDTKLLKEELIQVMAVCAAWIDCIDRREKK